MAASTDSTKNMSRQIIGQSAKKQKGKISKLLLAGIDGFTTKWPELDEGVINYIVTELTRFFESSGFSILSTRERKLLKRKTPTEEERLQRDALAERQKKTLEVRKEMVFGINEVTKALERDMLSLILVDRSAKPHFMTSHLPQLAASRKAEFAAVPQFTDKIGAQIGMQSVITLGFKRNCSFEETVQRISALISSANCAAADRPDGSEEDTSRTVKPVFQPVQVKVVVKDDQRAETLKSKKKKRRLKQLSDSLSSVGFPNKKSKIKQ